MMAQVQTASRNSVVKEDTHASNRCTRYIICKLYARVVVRYFGIHFSVNKIYIIQFEFKNILLSIPRYV